MRNREPLLTTQELADYLKVPLETIYAWRTRRLGPKGLKVGRYVRFRMTDVENWLTQQETE